MITWKYLEAEIYTKKDTLSDVISSVSWVCELNENAITLSINGKTGLEVIDLDPNNYIPYEYVTYNNIDQWVKEKIGIDNVLEIENSLREKLNDILNPKIKFLPFNFDENGVNIISANEIEEMPSEGQNLVIGVDVPFPSKSFENINQ